jgi:hypothetical protein
MKFNIDPEAYAETERMILNWLGCDCGVIGVAVVAAFRESDYGASEIVDALVTNIVAHMPDGITVELPAERAPLRAPVFSDPCACSPA